MSFSWGQPSEGCLHIAPPYSPSVLPISKTRWFICWWLVNILLFLIVSYPCSHIWWDIKKYKIKTNSTDHPNLFASLFDNDISESFPNKQIIRNHLNLLSPCLMTKYQKVIQTNKIDNLCLPLCFLIWWCIIKSRQIILPLWQTNNKQIIFTSLLPCLMMESLQQEKQNLWRELEGHCKNILKKLEGHCENHFKEVGRALRELF